MNLTSPSQVKAWCIENGFHPNRVLGQNFLIDRNALVAIVDAGLAPADAASPRHQGEGVRRGTGGESGDARRRTRVLEIGPGLGVLTEELLSRGCEVVAIEKDPVLAARLAQESKARAEVEELWRNLTVIEGDALAFASQASRLESPLSSRVSGLAPSPAPFDAMVSNLPYQAGTRILLELVQAREIPAMTVLVQTEVAERLAAREGSKMRSLAGVWAQLDYDVKIVRRVAASCFWPRPEVGSSVVRLTRHGRNAGFGPEARRLFHRLTKQAFEHRRKQLGSIFKDMIQSTARAEELANEDWINLTKGLMDHEQDA